MAEGGGTPEFYDTTGSTPNGTQGGVWMGGAAPEVDAAGNIWSGTGDGATTTPYDGSDSTIELSPQLGQEQLFAPGDWLADNIADRDLGSSPPALLQNGTIFQAGKSQRAFLLSQASLGGIGGQLGVIPLCQSAEVDGGHAVVGSVVYLPCQGGTIALQTTPSLSVLWQATDDIGAPPIDAGGLVWSIHGSDLYALDPTTGAIVQTLDVGGEANHFPTPSVGDGCCCTVHGPGLRLLGVGRPPRTAVAGAVHTTQLLLLDGRLRRGHLQLRRRGFAGRPAA